MPAPHAIKTLRFELRADAVPQARRLPERFGALCRQQLAVVLEEEFAAHCPPHQQLRLPQLVLMLPPIADRRLEAELPDLLRRALRTALAQLSASEKTTIVTTPEAASWLEVLEHFLRYGHLPWQVAAGSFSLDEVLRSVVTHQAAAFRALLVRLGQTAQRRQRLVWQLNADQLQLLLAVLEPIHAPFLHAYVLATLAAHRRQPLAPVTATALRGIIYELLLADLLLHAGTAFNRRAFLERQVRQLAAQYNLSFPGLLGQLVAAELSLTPRTQSALSVLLADLHQRYRPAAAPGTTGAPGTTIAAGTAGPRRGPARADNGADSSLSSATQLATTGALSASPQLAESPATGATAGTMTSNAAANTATSARTDAVVAATATATLAATATLDAAATSPATGATASAAPGTPPEGIPGSAAAATAVDSPMSPAAVLTYFLQHGSLPLSAPTLTPPQLLAGFPAWLAQGWRGLRPMLRAGGPAALHRLARLLAEPLLMQLLRLAVPGQVRPVQGVLEAAWQQPATRAAGHTRPDLWAHTFGYLLREDFQSVSSPLFQQWLTQQLATATTGQATADITTTFSHKHTSLSGNAANASATGPGPAAGNAFSNENAPADNTPAADSSSAPGSSLAGGNAPASRSAAAARPDAAPADSSDAAGPSVPANSPLAGSPTAALTPPFGSNRATDGTHAPPPAGPIAAGQIPAAGRPQLPGETPAADDTRVADDAASPDNRPAAAATAKPGNAAATTNVLVTGDAAAGTNPLAARAAAADPLLATGSTDTPSKGNAFTDNAPAAGIFADTPPGAGQAPAAGNGLSLLRAQQVLQYHLAEGGVPAWWPGSAASPARLRTLLAQVLRARPLPGFLRTQPLPAEARQRLAALADFAQLAGLLAARRLPGGAPPPAGAPLAALAGLERREATGAAGHPSGWLLLLRTAYLDFYLDGGPSTMATGAGLAGIRRLAAHYQLPLPATLGKIRRLLGTRPALLANACFASLNQLLPNPVAAKAAQAAASGHQAAGTTQAAPQRPPAAEPATPAAGSSFPEAQRSHLEAQNRQIIAQSSQTEAQNRQIIAQSSQTKEQSGQEQEQSLQIMAQSGQRREQSSFPEAQSHQSEAQRGHSPATARLTEMPTGVAARDLVFYLLRYQRRPWWAPASLTPAHQRQLLTQVAHEYRAGLQALVHAHRTEPAFRQMLAELASFAQLARFVASPGRAAPGRLASAVLAALDQQLARAGEPVARLLRQAYLTAAFHPNPADIRTLAAGVRAQATRAGTTWRTVLRSVAWLHRQLPALATAPFFAALLAAAATYEQVAGQSRANGPGARSRARPTSSAQSQSAATAFQALEEYLRTGQAPGFAAGGNPGEPTAGSTSANGTATAGAPGNGHSALGNTAPSGPAAARPGTAAGALPQLLAGQWQLLLRPEYRATWQPLRPLLASRTVRTRLLAGLGETEFWQLLRQLYPSHYRLAFRLAADWQLLARQGLVKLSAPALFEVLLALIQSTPVASWRPETTVRTLLAAEETLWPQADTKREHSRAGQLLAAIGRRGLVLRGPLGALLLLHQQAGQVAKPVPPATPIPFIKEEDRPLETVYLANAGLVLLWPFLTMLFDRLGYLENQQFRDEASRARAALLLQFLTSGAAAVPEYQLPLNKLLCGIAQSQPLPRELALTAAETELGESLLKAVIARWDALKNTSIAGLRETFLLRAGKLDWLPDDRIVLTVEPKTLDILLDRRPWSISIIKLPWMAAPLYVTWR